MQRRRFSFCLFASFYRKFLPSFFPSLFSKGLAFVCILLQLCNDCRSQSVSPGDTTFCQGGRAVLTANPAGTTYQWRLNGTNMAGATARTYTATTSGSYDVVVTTAGTPATYPAITVTVNPKPVAKFDFSTGTPRCLKDPVQFINQSTGEIVKHLWDFGDSSGINRYSTDSVPIHRFVGANKGGPQTFSVKLVVTNKFGCDSAVAKSITFDQPSSKLGGTGFVDPNIFRNCSSSSATFTFINQSTTSNKNYEIIWGDGTSTPYPSPFTSATHTYTTGDYTLKFIVTGTNNCVDTGVYRVFVGTTPSAGLPTPGGATLCVGESLTFLITNTEGNTPGTVYSLTFSDSPLVIINYDRPPPSITHIYARTSCGSNSPGYANSFYAKIVATNPCFSSSNTAEPIYVSNKIKAAFSNSPGDTVCVGSTINFVNESSGNTFTSQSCTPDKIVWKLNPFLGRSINCGDTGSDKTDLFIPDLWAPGSTTLCLKYTSAGKDTIRLKTGGTCKGNSVTVDSVEKVICVNPLPTASFTASRDSGCAPLLVNTSTATNTPFCGIYKYRWTITYSNPMSCSTTGRSYRYTNNTDSTTREPAIEFLNPGVYTLGLVVISPGGTCSSAIYTKQITVKGKPNVAFTAATIPAAICQNSCITPRATYNCYINANTVFRWSFPGSVQDTSTAQNPGMICYNTPGTYTISLKVSNECGDTVITRQITVSTAPAITVSNSSNPTGCGTSTGSIDLSGLAPNTTYAVTYTKDGGSPTTISLPSNGNGIIKIPNLPAGNYTSIRVSLNGCVSNTIGSIGLADPSSPAPPVARSNSPVCAGDTIKLFTDTITGAAYSWTGPSFSDSRQNPTLPNASSAKSGTYSLTIKLNGCTSAPGSVSVAVRPKPARPTVCTTPVAYCFNDPSAALCATASAGNTLIWFTKFPQTTTFIAPVPRTDTAGTVCYAVYQQSDTSSCKSDTINICVTVTAKITNNVIKGDQTICNTGSAPAPLVQASGNTGGGNGSFSYKWQQSTDGGTTWVAVGTGPSFSPALLAGSTRYRRIVSSGNCSDTSNIVTISTGEFGNNTIADAQSVCAGSVPALLTGSAPLGGNGSFSYEWYDSTSGRPRRLAGTLQNYQPPALDTTTFYIRKAASGGCTAYTPWIRITVFDKPVAGIISSDTVVCEGGSVTIHSRLTKGGTGRWQYHPLPVTGSWLDTPETADSIIYRNVQLGFAVRLLVVSDGVGQGCNLADTSNTIYIQTSPKSRGGNTDADDIVCNSSNAGVIALTNYTGQIIRWDSSGTRGASWGRIANLGTTLAYKDLRATTWFRAVVKSNTCPEAFSDTTVITIVGSVTNSAAGNDTTLCNASSVTLRGNLPSVGTGRWKQVSGPPAFIADTTLNNTPVNGLVPGNTYRFAWIITGNGLCSGSSDSVDIVVWPPTTPANAGNDTAICGSTSPGAITLHANQPRSYETGQWTVLSGSGGSFGNPSSPVSTFSFPQTGTYKLLWRISNAARGSCPPSEDTLVITAQDKPATGSIVSSSSTMCYGDSVTLTYDLHNGIVLKWQYNFTPDNPATWLDVNTSLPVLTVRNVERTFAARVLVVLPGSTGCAVADTSKPVTVNVTVNFSSPISIKVLPSLVLEQPDYTFQFAETSPQNTNYRYLWSMGDRTLQTRSGKEITYTYPDTGVYKVKLLVTDFLTGCKASDSVTVKILYIPGYLYIPDAMCVGCSNNSLRQFLPLGKGLKKYHLRIFSKWGKLLFETTGLNPDGSPNEPWHADFSNTRLQQDSFMWIVEAQFMNNTEWKGMVYPDNPGRYVKSGFITVIK